MTAVHRCYNLAGRNRTCDRLITTLFYLYSQTLYQLSYSEFKNFFPPYLLHDIPTRCVFKLSLIHI